MESVLHTMYVVAIKDTSAWAGDGPADLSMIGFWNLVVVWLKVSWSSDSKLPHSKLGISRCQSAYSA
jgi:hypothetical protein